MDKHAYLGNAEIASIEGLYEQFLKDNNSVDPSWQQFFKGFDIRNYAKYILRDGTTIEKRELLGCLRSEILLNNKQIKIEV